MRKNFFKSNNMFHKLNLAIMLLVVCFTTVPVLAADNDKQDAKVANNFATKATISPTAKNQKTLCKKVAILIKENKIDKYVPERRDFDPRSSEYLNLDIDKDGKADKIIVGSGSEGSFLEVSLSSGIEYDVDEGGFITIFRFEGNVYAVVTYREWNANRVGSKTIDYRLYKLTKDKAIIVCDKF